MTKASGDSVAFRAIKAVVEGGYCIGCGLCSHLSDGILRNRMNEFGLLQPLLPESNQLPGRTWEAIEFVCPFTNKGPDETEIAARHFGGLPVDNAIGRFAKLYIGHQADKNVRMRATSGGIISWVLCRLLETGKVDYVIHVKSGSQPEERLFEYGVSRTVGEVLSGAGSRYYPVELSGVLSIISENPGTCAIVGLPCFLKGIRRLIECDERLSARIHTLIGLVCGHLKSAAFADCLAWQLGIPPGQLEKADFRVKFSDLPADDYGFSGAAAGRTMTQRTRELFGGNWGHNLFRYPACDYCDDVFGECGDLTVGDAWLPEYVADSGGNSVVVVRSKELLSLLEEGNLSGSLILKEVAVDDLKKSQAGGLRDRREGLQYRLWLKQREGVWVPKKRFSPEIVHIDSSRRGLYRSRMELMALSHVAWKSAVDAQDYMVFYDRMMPSIGAHHDWCRTPWKRSMHRLARGIKRLLPSSVKCVVDVVRRHFMRK